MRLETRICTALAALLVVGHLALTAVAPQAVVPPRTARALQALEERVATDPSDTTAITQLAHGYIALRRPELAIGLIRAASPEVLQHPAVSGALAHAYAASDRVHDALTTSALALARCARAMGTGDVLHVSAPPSHTCSERTLASLERHHTALSHMQRWGVQTMRDPRAALAHRIAVRNVSMASYATP